MKLTLQSQCFFRSIHRRVACAALMLALAPGILTTSRVQAQTYSVLYNFTGGADGSQPVGTLVMDSKGNLYGETGGGGTYNAGTVFQMKLTSTGWIYRPIYEFAGATNNDGNYPWGGVIFDPKGNLYGVTIQGGTAYSGSVFELKPQANGSWTETQLYVFQTTADGVFPEASLVFDKAGNLYGTTVYGGAYGYGVVYKITP